VSYQKRRLVGDEFKVFDGATTFMVMVITFLTLTNIAIGYGLAVYVQKNFGTLIYRRRAKAVAENTMHDAAPAASPPAVVTETAPAPAAVAPPEPVAPPLPDPVVAEAPASPAPPAVVKETAEAEAPAVEVKAESDTVDEENVLAGIEEFRSQLAKMSENTASETAEQPAGAPQQALATAVN
jgi:hypothetical protein